MDLFNQNTIQNILPFDGEAIYKGVIFSRKEFIGAKKEWLIILGIIFSFYFFVITIRFVAYESVSDYKELVKLALFIFVVMSFKNIKISDIEKVFIVYMLLNFLLSISQFMHINNAVLDSFYSIYANPNQLHSSLSQSSVRAIGLSEDPGSNGVISMLFYSFFTTLLLFDKLTILRCLGAVLSITVLFLTQSKSSLISAVLLSTFILSIVIFNKKKFTISRFRLVSILSLVSMLGYWFSQNIFNSFYGYKKLVNAGLNVSSMRARADKWREFYNVIVDDENILTILFGSGRGFLEINGVKSSVFDNDYIYLFVNYGIAGLLIFSTTVFSTVLIYTVRFSKINISEKIVLFVFFSGCIASLAISFYINLKVICLIALFLSLTFSTKKSVHT